MDYTNKQMVLVVYNLRYMKPPFTKNNNLLANIAYIDGQNLRKGTTKREPSWEADLKKTRFYLTRKYNVTEAYYYMGYRINDAKHEAIYQEIEEAGFILKFRRHNVEMRGEKKGNVDADIIFDIMKRIYRREPFDKIVLVSGDGDYRMLVDFLIEEERLEKMLFPKFRYASSLYKSITLKYFEDLSISKTIKRIGKPKRKKRR